jgi:hypothetical protein
MILRARHLFVAWLAYGALQLALLGAGGIAGAPAGIGSRDTRPQTESQSVSLTKRVFAPELIDRRATITPFAPAVHVRLDLLPVVAPVATTDRPQLGASFDAVALPPARAPPALA